MASAIALEAFFALAVETRVAYSAAAASSSLRALAGKVPGTVALVADA